MKTKKFLALYMAPIDEMDRMMALSTPEQMKEGMDAWNEWAKMHKKELAELGSPLGKNKRVQSMEISDVRNEVTGYSVIKAASHEDAARVVQDNPHLQIPGGYIEVLEFVDIPT